MAQHIKPEKAYRAVIAELIRLRKATGRTQTDVARILKTDQSQVSKYERLERELGVVDFVRYCRALNIDPTDVIRLVDKHLK